MDGFLEGANVQEVAAPDVTDNQVENVSVEETDGVVESTSTDGAAEPEQKETQSPELNAQYAAIRRKAEEDAQKRINGEFKRLFGNIQNPATGRNIETYADYLQAVEYQQRAAQNKLLEEKGINPALIEQMINNSPAMRQAQQILEENSRSEAQRKLDADLKIVSQISPEIQSIADIENHPSYAVVLDFVQKGLSLPDAFKLANYDSLSSQRSEAAKQAAINQARSKNHMETTNGVSTGSETLVPIPDSVLGQWKRSYPDLTMEQLTQKYNSSL